MPSAERIWNPHYPLSSEIRFCGRSGVLMLQGGHGYKSCTQCPFQRVSY